MCAVLIKAMDGSCRASSLLTFEHALGVAAAATLASGLWLWAWGRRLPPGAARLAAAAPVVAINLLLPVLFCRWEQCTTILLLSFNNSWIANFKVRSSCLPHTHQAADRGFRESAWPTWHPPAAAACRPSAGPLVAARSACSTSPSLSSWPSTGHPSRQPCRRPGQGRRRRQPRRGLSPRPPPTAAAQTAAARQVACTPANQTAAATRARGCPAAAARGGWARTRAGQATWWLPSWASTCLCCS